MKCDIALFTCGLLAAGAVHQVDGRTPMPVVEGFGNGVVLEVNAETGAPKTCLGALADQKNVVLSKSCSAQDPLAVWYFLQDGSLGLRNVFLRDVSDNEGAIQVYPATYNPSGPLGGKFEFLSSGRIRNVLTQLCIGLGYHEMSQDVQFLEYQPCSKGIKWTPVEASLPYTDEATPVLPSAIEIEQAPGIVQQPHPKVPETVQVKSTGTSTTVDTPKVVSGFTKALVSHASDNDNPEDDHYLCACLLSSDEDDCIQAVKAGCVIGHIPAPMCRESFEEGKHDRISAHIIELIAQGSKCPSGNQEKLRAQVAESELPVSGLHGEQVVTAEDHYLCVCLDNVGDMKALEKTCEDAVRIACAVGHIPEAECFASFDKHDHAQVVESIFKLIDSGANCAQTLSKASGRGNRVYPREPHQLCVCLEDRHGVPCMEQVDKACKSGAIPARDCELAIKADFHHSVTRHIMHLIDHGSECNLGEPSLLHFTNNRCHCKQSWIAPNGRRQNFPNNCNDPGGEKGFAWCETYVEEGCVGVGDSMAWDRCDRPKQPKYHLGDFVDTSVGRVSPVDHYLCVCVDPSATDELCKAAVKAACMVGHLPSEECAESFRTNEHKSISRHIVREIAHGERCNNIELTLSSSLTQEKDSEAAFQRVHQGSITSACGHGRVSPNAAHLCECFPGYDGLRCDFCAKGYYGYPTCSLKQDCEPPCKYGTCDFSSGVCVCQSHRAGIDCGECESGFSGSDCMVGISSVAAERLLLFGFVLLLTYMLCCTKAGTALLSAISKLNPLASMTSGGAYSRLGQNPMDYTSPDGDEVDLFYDEEDKRDETEKQKVASHSGLAV